MNKERIIRAWKDPAYRASLSPEQRAELPEHPAGVVELDDAELGHAVGGRIQDVLDIEALTPIRITKASAVDGCPSLRCTTWKEDLFIDERDSVKLF